MEVPFTDHQRRVLGKDHITYVSHGRVGLWGNMAGLMRLQYGIASVGCIRDLI